MIKDVVYSINTYTTQREGIDRHYYHDISSTISLESILETIENQLMFNDTITTHCTGISLWKWVDGNTNALIVFGLDGELIRWDFDYNFTKEEWDIIVKASEKIKLSVKNR